MEPTNAKSWEMEDYFRKKSKLQMNSRLKEYFSMLEKAAESVNNNSVNFQIVSESMLMAFNYLSQAEKIRYLIENVDYINKAINNNIQRKTSNNSNYTDIFDSSKSLETTCQIGQKKLFSCCRQVCLFSLDKNKKIVTLQRNKQTLKVYNLRNYLVHRNIKHKNSLVLRIATSQTIDEKQRTAIFTFSSSIFQKIFLQTWDSVMTYRNEELLFFLTPTAKQKNRQNSARVFLNNKNFKQLMKYKQKVIEESRISKKWATLYEKQKRSGQSIMILQSRNNDKLICLEAIYQKNAKTLKKEFMSMMEQSDNKCPLVTDSYILEEYKQIYQAIYQKLDFHGHYFQLIFIKDSYPTNNSMNKSQKQDVLFIKGVNNIVVMNFLEYMLASITVISNKVSKLTLYCSFNINQIVTSKLVKTYLLGLIHQSVAENKRLSHNSDEALLSATSLNKQQCEQLSQISDSKGVMESQNQIFFDFGDPDNDDQVFSIRSDQFSIIQTEKSIQNKQTQKTDKTTTGPKFQKLPSNASEKKYRYLLQPIKDYNIENNLMKQHFLFKDWRRRKNGGVICHNQELLNAQKKVFKEIISSMGSQIFKGGNILNVSLPVTIFKKQSHIQVLAKNFVYAPILMENRIEVIEKMKYTVLLALTFGSTGISLQKPFFTFLGQTVQYWVGGCPVYVEQITRYPPISSYLFIGRGYRIHGQVDPKVSFGVNGVKGYSELPVFIQFDDGTVFELIFGKMVISGLFFGEREFNFYDKMYIYDRKNNLFAQTVYGPRQKSVFGKNSQPVDFYHGKIYEVTPQFRQIFQKKIPREYPSKKYIVKQVSNYQGIWNGKAYFDQIEYYDFETQLPCQPTKQQYMLPSDSSFRPQLIKLIQGNIQQSQRLKVIAEQGQRRDRKLREKNSH